MNIPKYYSVTSSDILPEKRDINGIYHIRDEEGFRIFRVSQDPSRDWVPFIPGNKFKKLQKVTGGAMIGVALDEDADIVLMSSGSGSTIGLPPASKNIGRVVTLMHFNSSFSHEYIIQPTIRIRVGSSVGISKLKAIGSSSPSEPLLVEAFSDGEHWYVLSVRH